ncbi:hypothetical protein HMPREF9103_00311 [Lentilactobacillus parafarraginis F0439]|uniref:Uncharacterized protein n=1 Tax=Lentilactobacillus parafarraginis F0439 TaxID=797515 RepID=G9ZKR3_9LACO|nr:hypothetical protein HMPREF9103_00311 [Lentilactobacillus parafarraginis F0439]
MRSLITRMSWKPIFVKKPGCMCQPAPFTAGMAINSSESILLVRPACWQMVSSDLSKVFRPIKPKPKSTDQILISPIESHFQVQMTKQSVICKIK